MASSSKLNSALSSRLNMYLLLDYRTVNVELLRTELSMIEVCKLQHAGLSVPTNHLFT